jgi:hypothetical protein
MATWPEVHEHLAKTYADAQERPGGVLLFSVLLEPAILAAGDLWADPGTEAGERVAQPVAAHPLAVFGAPWLELLGAVGSAREAQLTSLLTANLFQPIGAYCLRDGALVLRLLLPLDGLRFVDLDEAIRAIAYQSTWTRDVMRGAAPP